MCQTLRFENFPCFTVYCTNSINNFKLRKIENCLLLTRCTAAWPIQRKIIYKRIDSWLGKLTFNILGNLIWFLGGKLQRTIFNMRLFIYCTLESPLEPKYCTCEYIYSLLDRKIKINFEIMVLNMVFRTV